MNLSVTEIPNLTVSEGVMVKAYPCKPEWRSFYYDWNVPIYDLGCIEDMRGQASTCKESSR